MQVALQPMAVFKRNRVFTHLVTNVFDFYREVSSLCLLEGNQRS